MVFIKKVLMPTISRRNKNEKKKEKKKSKTEKN